jgi:hypothetical protein
MDGPRRLFPFFFPLRPTCFLTIADIRLQRSDSGQIRNPRAVLYRAHRVRIAHAEPYVFRRVVANILHHCREAL